MFLIQEIKTIAQVYNLPFVYFVRCKCGHGQIRTVRSRSKLAHAQLEDPTVRPLRRGIGPARHLDRNRSRPCLKKDLDDSSKCGFSAAEAYLNLASPWHCLFPRPIKVLAGGQKLTIPVKSANFEKSQYSNATMRAQ